MSACQEASGETGQAGGAGCKVGHCLYGDMLSPWRCYSMDNVLNMFTFNSLMVSYQYVLYFFVNPLIT